MSVIVGKKKVVHGFEKNIIDFDIGEGNDPLAKLIAKSSQRLNKNYRFFLQTFFRWGDIFCWRPGDWIDNVCRVSTTSAWEIITRWDKNSSSLPIQDHLLRYYYCKSYPQSTRWGRLNNRTSVFYVTMKIPVFSPLKAIILCCVH